MSADKMWPSKGQQLIHRFRAQRGQVRAEVVGVDTKSGRVAVRIGDKVYSSLSAAAQAVSGHAQNGWVYWGLKKQKRYGSVTDAIRDGTV